MNAGSIAVLAVIAALMVFVIWRNIKKGAPCECGGSHKLCGGHCHCHCHDKKK